MTAELEKTTDTLSLNVNSKTLLNALLSLSKVVSSNPIVPSIENVHATITSGLITLRATNLSTTLTTIVHFNTEIGERYDGKFLIPHKLSTDLLKSLPEVSVVLQHQHTYGIDELGKRFDIFKITYRVDKQKYVLQSENPSDFPKQIEVIGETIALPADQIKEGLKICLNSVGTDDLKPQMEGIYFDSDTTNLTLVATNGHQIVSYETHVTNETQLAFTLRSGAAAAIIDAITSTMQFISLTFTKKAVLIDCDNFTIASVLIEERYPDYKSALPTQFPNSANIDLNDWKTLVKRSLLFSNKTSNSIRNQFADNKLRVSSEDLDFQTQSDQEIEIDGTFDNTTIGLNGKFLLNATQGISGHVLIEFSQPNRMVAITVPNTLAKALMIGIMPVFLAENA